MTVNPGKSQLLIQLRGKKGGKWIKQRTRRVDDKPVFIAKMPQGRVINLPMVEQIKYLGVILSFGMFERATVRHRIKCAETNRHRPQHVLQGKHRLAVAHRLRIWQACVVTSMLHGVAVTGVTPHELRMLRSCMARHVRAMASCPVHLTRESTAHLFHRLKIQEPHVQIQHRLTNIVQRVNSSEDPMINDPGLGVLLGKLGEQLDYAVGHWTVWQTQRNSHDMQEDGVTEDVQAGHAMGQMVSTRVGEATCSFVCPECLLAFPDIPAVKKHHRKAHGRALDKLAGQVDREKFGAGGDPTCRYCQQAFATWPNLVKHIHDRSCPGHWQHIQNTLPCASFKAPKESHRLDDATVHLKGGHTQREDRSPTSHPEPQAALYNERLRSHLDKHGWPAIVDNAEICAMLTHHCCLCHQWVANPLRMKTHIQRVHKGMWEKHGTSVDQACKLLSSVIRSPCQYCQAKQHSPAQHAPRCTVTWQACLLKHVWDLNDVPHQFDWQGPPKPESQRTADRRQKRNARINYLISMATGLPLKKTMQRDFFTRALEGSTGESSGLRLATDPQKHQAGQLGTAEFGHKSQCVDPLGHDDVGSGVPGTAGHVRQYAAVTCTQHGGGPSPGDGESGQAKGGHPHATGQEAERAWQGAAQGQRDSSRRGSGTDHEGHAPNALEARSGHKPNQHGHHDPVHLHEQAQPSGTHTPSAVSGQPGLAGEDGQGPNQASRSG